MQTDNSTTQQSNAVQHSKETPSGEGLSNPENMADNYASKIQSLLQGNSGMTLQDRSDAIRELLFQAQNQREIELLRKISLPANRNFLVGSGNPQDNNNQNNHNNNNNVNNNSNNDSGTVTTQAVPLQSPVTNSVTDNDNSNKKDKADNKNKQGKPTQKQTKTKTTSKKKKD